MAGDLASGRAASIARRAAMSGGKTALPVAAERVRTGFRSAGLLSASGASAAPTVTLTSPPASVAAPVLPPDPAPQAAPLSAAPPSAAGRLLSMQRRRLVSAGKQALQAIWKPAEPARATEPAAPAATSLLTRAMESAGSAQNAARVRRTTLALFGRTALSTLPAAPSRPVRQATDAATLRTILPEPAVTRVTHSRNGAGDNVTGSTRGNNLPVSGIKKLAPNTTTRGLAPKVGMARTETGQTVTGTLVRSTVAITGDEAGRNRITGEADQAPVDDLTPRAGTGAGAQFPPISPIAMGAARGLSRAGSRARERAAQIETTLAGKVVTGSAVGLSQRVTGDDSGACRAVTGTQYLAPAARQTACGGQGGGTAPGGDGTRADPVTRGKVMVAETIAGLRVTGPDFSPNAHVTGGLEGHAALVTGSQYQSLPEAVGGVDAAARERMAMRLRRRQGSQVVSGDIEAAAMRVSGADRGANRDITGTPYAGAALPPAPSDTPLMVVNAGFSIMTPQRRAQTDATGKAQLVTGSFAIGAGKVTGNLEFQGRSRLRESGETLGHDRISGEGAATGAAITGSAWTNVKNVTGTDAAFAADRNPSERGPKARAFAGSASFKPKAIQDDARQLVTGMAGFFSKTGAKVTLSGGARS